MMEVLLAFILIFVSVFAERDEELKIALENPDLFGGDMLGIDGPLDIERNAIPGQNYRWPGAVVPYEIDDSLDEHVPLIKKAMEDYHTHTCVRFVPRKNQLEYIRMFAGTGCYSEVGRRGNQQSLSLGRGCYRLGTIVHELGHALGFYHEQNRSDRDDYLKIYMQNVEEGAELNFARLKPSQNLLLTPFDYDSIMIYGNTAFSKDKKSVTMEAKNGQKLLNPYSKQGMTKSDIERVRKMYECKYL